MTVPRVQIMVDKLLEIRAVCLILFPVFADKKIQSFPQVIRETDAISLHHDIEIWFSCLLSYNGKKVYK